MRAIVLAAGQGIRLLPLTADRPKCMVPLAGRPLLHHLLDSLRAAGIEDIVVVAGYRAERLDAPGCRIVLNPAYADTNMVGTLFAASECMDDGADLLVSYADTVFEPRVIRAVLDQGAGDLGWDVLDPPPSAGDVQELASEANPEDGEAAGQDLPGQG